MALSADYLLTTTPTTTTTTGGTVAHAYTAAVGGASESTVATQLWVYASPLIFIAGLTGNLLILLVLRRSDRLGRGASMSAANVYLNLLALADSGVLVTGLLPEWLRQSRLFWLRELHPYACRTEKFLFYVTADTAIWILVIFTVDRTVAVLSPLRRVDDASGRRRALLCCAFAALVGVAKNAHVFWTRGAEYDALTGALVTNCGKPLPHRHFERFVRPWIVLASISLLPFVTIIVCNALIMRALAAGTRQRASEVATAHGPYDKRYMQTTVMCLSVSFAFLVCIPTSIVLLIGKPYWAHGSSAYYVAKAVNNLLVYVNHSVNFLLYCLTGRLFRAELTAMLRGRPTRRQSAATLLSTWLQTDALGRRRSTDPRHVGSLVAGACDLGRRPLVWPLPAPPAPAAPRDAARLHENRTQSPPPQRDAARVHENRTPSPPPPLDAARVHENKPTDIFTHM